MREISAQPIGLMVEAAGVEPALPRIRINTLRNPRHVASVYSRPVPAFLLRVGTFWAPPSSNRTASTVTFGERCM